MNSLQLTLQQIAAILSFEVDANQLKTLLSKDVVNWDSIVKVASAHLVLTTVYSRLKQKSLLDLLPEELNSYLDELSTINRNRNTAILEEVNTISALFSKHNINHVFVKGAALLAADFYTDYCERMIGDIDVLVEENQTNEAYDLLEKHDYYPLEVDPQRKYIKHRHLNRLIPKHGLAAVEIHHTLLTSTYKDYLDPTTILKSKQRINGVYVPGNLELLHHSVLSNQLNDFGNLHKVITLKSAYDSLLILHQIPDFDFKTLLKDAVFRNYFLLLNPFFRDIPDWNFSYSDRLKLNFNALKLKHRSVYVMHRVIIESYIFGANLFKHLKIALQHRGHIHFLISRLKSKKPKLH